MSDVLPRLTTALESRYRVAREVGVGGMATVYLAHDLRHERDVAIKVLHPDLAAALGADRFLAEIKTTAKLQHPHILALLDSGEAGGLLYYVMPYVAGESLRARLDRETQLAVDDAVRIAREVASALDYAHRNGVVHRDIKPENILLHEDQALVADFGIALAVSAAGGPRMTQTGLSLGTPAYMAPEQAMGERAIDGRADIYALGAVLYEMLVGEAPFTGPTVQAIVARVMTENPRPVTGQRKSVPANVNAAVLRALEKLPADRFHSPAEFSAALVTSSFSSQASATSESLSISRARIPRATIPWAVAAIAIAAAVVFAVSGKSDSNNEAPIHLSVDLPSEMDLPPGSAEVLGISDDGQILAFGGQVGGTSQLVLRRLGSDSFTSVPGASDLNGSAVFSADGKWIAFNAGGKVLKAPAVRRAKLASRGGHT
jgi:serine/threonine-protein kinase